MNDKSINKLTLIQDDIETLASSNPIKPEIVCISKTFSINQIKPLIDHGHIHFGENKLQEAEKKWTEKDIVAEVDQGEEWIWTINLFHYRRHN